MSKGNEFTLKEAIDQLLQTYKLDGKLNEVKLMNSWEQIMGPAIQKYTRNLYINSRVLYVELSSAPLREELSYGRSKIVKMLNEAVGASVIDDVVLR
jgi:predicted nucleic acid-binding Zn ribbon protein